MSSGGIRLKDQYDWVVLGDHPGALLSGGLAARLGLSVLIIPIVPSARAMISAGGQCLDPEPNFLIGLGKVERTYGLVRDCLASLGILPSEAEKIEAQGALPQVAIPGKRVSFAPDDAVFRRELEREFSAKLVKATGLLPALSHGEGPLAAFWKRLPERLTLVAQGKPRRFEEAQTLDQVLKKLERSAASLGPEERAWFSRRKDVENWARRTGDTAFAPVLSGLGYGISESRDSRPALAEVLHFLSVGRTGASYRGGMTSLRGLLLALAERAGAHIPEKAECKRIFVENGKFVGVQVAARGSVIGARGGILGCALDHARERLAVNGRKWKRSLKKSPAPSGWRFTLGLTVRAEAISPGVSRRLVWKEPGAPALEIEIAAPSEYGIDEPANRLVFLRTVLPYDQASLDIRFQRLLAARMLRQLSEILPFSDSHLVRVYPDFRGDLAVFSEAYGYPSPATIPENLRVFARRGSGSSAGVEGLFVGTGEAYPEHASLGPTVAALEATAWIAHRSGLAGPIP